MPIWKDSSRKRFLIKSVAALVLISFLTYDISWAGNGLIPQAQETTAIVTNPVVLRLPEKIGRIDAVSVNQGAPQSPVIYHIQDAHALYDAQKNLAQIIQFLIREKKISLILVEGGSGDVSLSSLRKLASQGERRTVAQRFLKSGAISGEEYLELASDYPLKLIGIENRKLYLKNVRIFLKALRRKRGALKDLTAIEIRIRFLEDAVYPSEYARLTAMKRNAELGTVTFQTYLGLLRENAAKLGIDLRQNKAWAAFEKLREGRDVKTFDQESFFKEIRHLESKVRKAYLRSPAAQKLERLTRQFDLIKKLFTLELTRDEYAAIIKKPEVVDLSAFSEKLRGLEAQAARYENRDSDLPYLEKSQAVFTEFYRLAVLRDRTFVRKIQNALQKNKPQNAILITGGFHSDHLGRLFREKHIPRVLISPKVAEIERDVQLKYEKLFRAKLKSTLRMPSTFGTPVYAELEMALDRAAVSSRNNRLERLIQALNVDRLFQGNPDAVSAAEPPSAVRSEVRANLLEKIPEWFPWAQNMDQTTLVTIAVLGILGFAAAFGYGVWRHIQKRKVIFQMMPPEEEKGEETAIDFEPAEEALALGDQEDFFEVPFDLEEVLLSVPEEEPGAEEVIDEDTDVVEEEAFPNPGDKLAQKTREYFEKRIMKVPRGMESLIREAELRMPMPYEAIPEELGPKNKLLLILNRILEEMRAMDNSMKSKQKEISKAALQMAVAEGYGPDFEERYFQHIEGEYQKFEAEVMAYMQTLPQLPEDMAKIPVNPLVQKRYERLPRIVKILLSHHIEFFRDPEIQTRLFQIIEKLEMPPPMAEDLRAFVIGTFSELVSQNEAFRKALEEERLAQSPEIAEEKVAIEEFDNLLAARSNEELRERFARLEADRGQLEHTQKRLSREIAEAGKKHQELLEAINAAETEGGFENTAVAELLRPDMQEYQTQLETLERESEACQVELDTNLQQTNRIREILRARGTQRSEVRRPARLISGDWGVAVGMILVSVFLFGALSRLNLIYAIPAAILAMGLSAYGFSLLGVRQNARTVHRLNQTEGFSLDWKKIFHEIVPMKKKEEWEFYEKENSVAGLLTFFGMMLAPVALGFFFHETTGGWAWGWTNWLLTSLGCPIAGAIIGFFLPLLIQEIHNRVIPLWRMIRFPFHYERLLIFYAAPPSLLDADMLLQGLKAQYRVSDETLDQYFREWIERGGRERLQKLFENTAYKGYLNSAARGIYDDYVGYVGSQELLLQRFARNAKERKEILVMTFRWRQKLASMEGKSQNTMKVLYTYFARSEKDFKHVVFWMDALLKDPWTPWKKGGPAVVSYMDAIKKLLALKNAARKRFSLSDKEFEVLNQYLVQWARFGGTAKQRQNVITFLSAILEKVIATAPNKHWFGLSLSAISKMSDSFFANLDTKGLLEEYTRTIGYQVVRGRLLHGVTPEQKKMLTAQVEALETVFKTTKINPAHVLSPVFARIEKLPPAIRFELLQGLVKLNPGQYMWGPKLDLVMDLGEEAVKPSYQPLNITEAYLLWLNKEIARRRVVNRLPMAVAYLAELDNKLHAAPTTQSMQEFLNFYEVLLNKIDPAIWLDILKFTKAISGHNLEVFIASILVFAPYYQAQRHLRDFKHLPVILQAYLNRYGKLVKLTESLLDALTDPTVKPEDRVSLAHRSDIEQRVLEYGFPPHVIEVRDAISFDAMVEAIGSNDLVTARVQHPVVKKALAKMGREGLYTYWEEQQPSYYKRFLSEMSAVKPDFFKPGEKFRIDYTKEPAVTEAELTLEGNTGQKTTELLVPVFMIHDAVKDFNFILEELRRLKFYDTYVKKIRPQYRGGKLEDHVTYETVDELEYRLRTKLINWKIPTQEKIDLLLRLYQIHFYPQMKSLIQASQVNEIDYWKSFLKLFEEESRGKNAVLKKNTKFYTDIMQAVENHIKEQIEQMKTEHKVGRRGTVQVVLTRGTPSDFYRGEISGDCCRERTSPNHFPDIIGLPTDPAFYSLKLVEDGHWIGNVYAMVFRLENGKAAFYLDQVSIIPNHRLVHSAVGDVYDSLSKLARGFVLNLVSLLADNGFDYLVVSSAGLSIHGMWQTELLSALNGYHGRHDRKTGIKPGGFEHQAEFSVSTEYIQGIGGNQDIRLSDVNEVYGNWIPLKGLERTVESRKAKLQHNLSRFKEKLDALKKRKEELMRLKKDQGKVIEALEAKLEKAKREGKKTLAAALAEKIMETQVDLENLPASMQQVESEIAEIRREVRLHMTELNQIRNAISTRQRSEVRTEDSALINLEAIKNSARAKFKLNPEDEAKMTEYTNQWSQIFPNGFDLSFKVAAIQAVLKKAVTIARQKPEFLFVLDRITKSANVIFLNAASVNEVLERVRETIVYGQAFEQLVSGLNPESREMIERAVNELRKQELWGRIKNRQAVLAEVFLKLRHLSFQERIAMLAELKDFSLTRYFPPSFTHESPNFAQFIIVWVSKEVLRSRLGAKHALLKSTLTSVDQKSVLQTEEGTRALFVLYRTLYEKASLEEQIFILRLMEKMPNEDLQAVMSTADVLLQYYQKNKQNDFLHIPELVRRYRIRFGPLHGVTNTMLDRMTDRSVTLEDRLKDAESLAEEQILLKFGFPSRLAGVNDVTPYRQLFLSVIHNIDHADRGTLPEGVKGEDVVRGRMDYKEVRTAVEKMGEDGLYTYWEAERPPYYQQFRIDVDASSVPLDFFKPGEKLRVAYESDTDETKDLAGLGLIQNPLVSLKDLIVTLRGAHPELYENFIGPKKEFLKDKRLEEVLDESNWHAVAGQFRKKIADWPMADDKKLAMIVLIHQILFYDDLKSAGEGETDATRKEMLYWEAFRAMFDREAPNGNPALKKDSKYHKEVLRLIRAKIARLAEINKSGREGLIQFILTRGTLSDFFRGEISEDCTKVAQGHFTDTLGLPTDPAFYSLRMVENGKLIGNIYAMVLINDSGEATFYFDQFAMYRHHRFIARGEEYDSVRRKFFENFIDRLRIFLKGNGFRYLAMAKDISTVDSVKTEFSAAAALLGAEAKEFRGKKPGGFAHWKDFGVTAEYLQGLSIPGELEYLRDTGRVKLPDIAGHGFVIPLDQTEFLKSLRSAKQKEYDEIKAKLKPLLETIQELKSLEKMSVNQIRAIQKEGQAAVKSNDMPKAKQLLEELRQERAHHALIKAELQKKDEEAAQINARIAELETMVGRSEVRTAALAALLELFQSEAYRKKLQAMFEIRRKARTRYDLDLAESSLEDRFAFAEIEVFAEGYLFSSVKLRGAANVFRLPLEDALRELDRYLADMVETIRLTGMELKPAVIGKMDAVSLLEQIQSVAEAKSRLSTRWYRFIDFYFAGQKNLWQKKYLQDAPELWHTSSAIQDFLSSSPGLDQYYERSLAPLFTHLMVLESRMKQVLRERIQKRPELVAALLPHVREVRSNFGSDATINWLLGTRERTLEGSIHRAIDGKPEYRNEQVMYGPTEYRLAKEMAEVLHLGEQDVLYDLGSGYGKILVYLGLTTKIGKLIGLELVRERVEESNRLKNQFRLDQVEFRRGNVRDMDFSDGTVFYLFNPFARETLEIVGEKLREIAEEAARRGKTIRIVSLGASTPYFDYQTGWLEKKRESQLGLSLLTYFESTPLVESFALARRSEVRKTLFFASSAAVFALHPVLFAVTVNEVILALAIAGLAFGFILRWFAKQEDFNRLKMLWNRHNERNALPMFEDGASLEEAAAQEIERGNLEKRLAQLDAEIVTKQKDLEEVEALISIASTDELETQRTTLQGDLNHLKQEKQVLLHAAREKKRQEGVEKLKRMLSTLPESLWAMLRRRFPGAGPETLGLSVDAVADSISRAWSVSEFFRSIVMILENYKSVYRWFQDQIFYQEFKKETKELGLKANFDQPREWVRFRMPEDGRTYSLSLSDRDVEYLLRGLVSGDCTNCGPGYVTASFITATGTHIADPGFLNFKLFRDGEWIGNVYALVMQKYERPVLVIDAIQIPWEGATPLFSPFSLKDSAYPVTNAEIFKLAEATLTAMAVYAERAGFAELWLSEFVSNFSDLKRHFIAKRQDLFDQKVREEDKVGGFKSVMELGFQMTPYVESIASGKAKRVWPQAEGLRPIQLLAPNARSEARFPSGRARIAGSGFQMSDEQSELLDAAIAAGEKIGPFNANKVVKKMILEDFPMFFQNVDGLERFVDESSFRFVRIKPKTGKGERAPPVGLGVDLGNPARDVFEAVDVEPKGENLSGFTVTFYVGEELFSQSSKKIKEEILAYGIYRAYREANEDNALKYPIDIDLEAAIQKEIKKSETWEARIPEEEKEDLGLLGGEARQGDLHVRARAFARFFGERSPNGIGTTYTALLRRLRGLRKSFSRSPDEPGLFDDLPEGAFDYLKGGSKLDLQPPDFDLLFAVSGYVQENKNEDLLDFLEKKVSPERRLIMLNTNAPSPWILEDIRKMVEGMTSDGLRVEREGHPRMLRLKHLYLDLPPELEPLVAQYLETGRASDELLEKIAPRFSNVLGPGTPESVKKDFERPELYIKILEEVFKFNMDAGEADKIQVHLYYEPREFPPMGEEDVPEEGPPENRGPFAFNLPVPGQRPNAPGNIRVIPPRDLPRNLPGLPPMPPMRGGRLPPGMMPPDMVPPGMLPPGMFPQDEMPVPGMPLSPRVKQAVQQAIVDAEENPDALTLFIKPLDEFLPDDLRNHHQMVSVLHIDKYTGFGPEKPENALALYMSEQASPTQKSFAMPILEEAPFYKDQVNPGLPPGVTFNEFKSYPDLIVSTSGEGGGRLEIVEESPSPESVQPTSPMVPAGHRSEIRSEAGRIKDRIADLEATQLLSRRKRAIRALIAEGDAAVNPLIDALASSERSVRAGAMQSLALIGNPRAIPALKRVVLEDDELRDAAKFSIRSIKRKESARKNPGQSLRPRKVNSNPRSVSFPSSGPEVYTGMIRPQASKTSAQAFDFVRHVMKRTPFVIDFDAASLVRKENGKLRLVGWGFFETLKVLEEKLPGELVDKIAIRIVNLDPNLQDSEIARALAITPELRSIVKIETLPVKHYAFQSASAYLRSDAFKVVSEKNRDVWNDKINILVEEPKAKEAIDGRKLFLSVLLHQALRYQIPDDLRLAVVKLLQNMGDSPTEAMSSFRCESMDSFGADYLEQLAEANAMLSRAA